MVNMEHFTRITFTLSILLMSLGINPVWAQHDDASINPNTQLSYYLKNPQAPAPVGIGAYGFYYDNNKILQPYVVTTNNELAVATINSLSAYNPSLQEHQHGANLQFNVMMQVKTSSGSATIWLQNTARFDTDTMEVNTPHDNIWNVSSPNANIVAYGLGKMTTSDGHTIYAYEGPEQHYSLPLTLKLGIAIKPVTQGVMVYFYNEPLGSGTFDKVLLPIQNVISANLIVAPAHTQGNISIDSELIWGGYCCGYKTTYNKMDSYLSLYYANTEGTFVPFRSLFTFGTETAEMANNLQVLHNSSGGHVVIGENNNHFLEQLKSLTPATAANNTVIQSALNSIDAITKGLDNGSVINGHPICSCNTIPIPAWIKNNAKWWADGTINDSTFASGIQYLIKQGIIQVPTTQTGSTTSQQIPSWVKNNAKWWAEGQVSDDEFIKAVQYLISNGIIQVGS